MTDVQDNYRRVSAGFDAAVTAASAGNWDAQTPCAGWQARDVVAHVVAGHRGVIANVRGGEPGQLGDDEDPKAAWQEARQAMEEIAGDPEAVAVQVDGPTGKMAAGDIISRFVTMDVLVHTWDLARAVGADEQLPEEAVRAAFEAMKPMDAMIRRPGVFGPRLDAPEGADLQTQFLYFLGRQA